MIEFFKNGILFGLGLSVLLIVWMFAYSVFKGFIKMIKGGGSDEQ